MITQASGRLSAPRFIGRLVSRQSAYFTERPWLAYGSKSITANYAPTSYGPNLQITPLSVKKTAESIQAVWTSFEVIVDVLQKITDGNEADRQTQTQALGLRKRMLSSIIFARRLGIDPEDDLNRHHHPRRAPRRVDEQAGTAAVLSLQQFYKKQLREVLDVLTSSMSEHLVQCKESILLLLKCLQLPIDSSCIHSAVSLFPPASQSPDPLALETELQFLSELLPTDVGKARLQQGS